GLPGAVALVMVLAGRPGGGAAAIAGVAGVGTAVALAFRARATIALDGGRLIALPIAGWLLVIPTSWSFAGPVGLANYQSGATRAAAAALLTIVVVAARRGGELAIHGPDESPDEPGERTGVLPVAVGLGLAGATVATGVWLVVSVLRLH